MNLIGNLLFRVKELFLKNWKAKIGSIFIATIFYINLQNSKILIKNVNIPIDYPKLESGKYFSQEPPKTLPVRIEGLREVVNYYSQFMRAIPDFSYIQVGENEVPIKTITGVPSGVKVTKLKKEIIVHIENQVTKQVPLEVNFEGNLPPNLEKASYEVRPSKVVIAGRASDLEKINKITLPPIQMDNVSESFVTKLKIPELPKGMYVVGGNRQVTVSVTITSQDSKVGEQTISGIPVRCVDVHPKLEPELSVEQVSLRILSKVPVKSSAIINGIQATLACNHTYDPERNKILPNDQPVTLRVRVSRSRELRNIEILQVIPEKIVVTYRIKPKESFDTNENEEEEKTIEEYGPPPDERTIEKGSE